jgi:hypothetical protein
MEGAARTARVPRTAQAAPKPSTARAPTAAATGPAAMNASGPNANAPTMLNEPTRDSTSAGSRCCVTVVAIAPPKAEPAPALSGRTWGPVFLTDRKAPARTATADVCPMTSQARMFYRRAAEIFAALTRPLDPAGRGWTLHQLSAARVDVRGL